MIVCYVAEKLGVWHGKHCESCHLDEEDELFPLCESVSPAGIAYDHCCGFDAGLLTTEEWAAIEQRDNQ